MCVGMFGVWVDVGGCFWGMVCLVCVVSVVSVSVRRYVGGCDVVGVHYKYCFLWYHSWW